MTKLILLLTLAFSSASFAGDPTHEEFIKGQLFGIVAEPTDPFSLPAMFVQLNAIIAQRVQSEPGTSRVIILNELADRILKDPRWVTSDVVSRAARNLATFLIRDTESSSQELATRFEFSIKKIVGEIDAGWSVKYQNRKVDDARVNRLEAIVGVYNTLNESRVARGGSGFTQFCEVAISQQPRQLHF